MSVLEDIRKGGQMTPDQEKLVVQEHGARGKKALDVIRAGRVKKYRDFFVVQGKESQYVVEGDFCTCRDYLYRLSQKDGLCYHILAVKIAEATGQYEPVEEWYSDLILQREYGEGQS